MKVRRAAVLAVAMFSMLLWLGCGDTFRPIATPISTPGGDPQPFHFGLVVSQGPSNGATSVIDTTGDTNIGNVVTGTTPVHTVASSSGAYTANRDSDTITVQAVSSPAEVATITLGDPSGSPVGPVYLLPYSNTANSDFRVYVAGFKSGTVLVVNASISPPAVSKTIQVGDTASHPVAIASSSDASKLFVLNRDAGNIRVISPVDNTISATINVGGNPVYAVTNLSGKALYVLSAGSSPNLKVIDPVTDTVLQTIGLLGTGNPECMATTMGAPCAAMFLDSVRQRLYVASYGDNTVRVFDTNQVAITELAKINVGAGPASLALLADGSRVYVLNKGETTGCSGEANKGRVSVINTTSNTTNACITVAPSSVSIAATSDSNSVLVPHQKVPSVDGTSSGTQVISTATNKIVADVAPPLVDPNGDQNGERMTPVFVVAQ